MEKKKTAIVGHSGFLGQAVCDIQKFDYRFNKRNIDLFDPNLREALPKDIGAIVFLAADPRLYYYRDKPGECLRNNFELVRAISEIAFEQFVFVSSIAVYKETENFSRNKATGWNEQMHFYGMAKLLAEQSVQVSQKRFCILRMSTFYSEDVTKGPLFDVLAKRQTFVDLDSRYSFLHITDAAEAVAHSVRQHLSGIYDVTDNRSYSLSELFPDCDEIEALGDNRFHYDSDNKAFTATGWSPRRNVVDFINDRLRAVG